MKLVAYLRISNIECNDVGHRITNQRKVVRDAANAGGHRIVKVCTDEGLSGALAAEDRPGLAEALDLIAAGKADGLIVRDLDRLARSVTVQEAVLASIWSRSGTAVFTAAGIVARDDPDDPMRTAMREMAAVFAGLERRMIAKRLRDGRKAKAAAGGHATGAVPYGWRSEKRSPKNPHGKLVEVPAEQAALTRMLALHKAGSSSREIAAALTAEGFPTKRGGQWASATVTRILNRATKGGAS